MGLWEPQSSSYLKKRIRFFFFFVVARIQTLDFTYIMHLSLPTENLRLCIYYAFVPIN